MRPSREEVIIKESGMHAVEDYLMSRYQMYWQIYFHPVSRGGEVLLNLALKRAKHLHETGYTFKQAGRSNFYLQEWIMKMRFVNRDLFKYLPFDGSVITISELEALFEKAGIDPEYYFFSDSYSDLPYDYDRPGSKSNRRPIQDTS